MAALIPDESQIVLTSWFPIKAQQATSGTRAATYKLVVPHSMWCQPARKRWFLAFCCHTCKQARSLSPGSKKLIFWITVLSPAVTSYKYPSLRVQLLTRSFHGQKLLSCCVCSTVYFAKRANFFGPKSFLFNDDIESILNFFHWRHFWKERYRWWPFFNHIKLFSLSNNSAKKE